MKRKQLLKKNEIVRFENEVLFEKYLWNGSSTTIQRILVSITLELKNSDN